MKKIILKSILIATLCFSCKKSTESVEKPMLNTPVENSNDSSAINREETSEIIVPDFEYAEADDFAEEYARFTQGYIVATKYNDAEALKFIGLKLNEFQRRGVELAKRVPQEEAVKFQDFLNSLEQYFK